MFYENMTANINYHLYSFMYLYNFLKYSVSMIWLMLKILDMLQKQCIEYPHMRKGKLQNSLKEIHIVHLDILLC